MKTLFKSIAALVLLSLLFTACDSGPNDTNYQADTERLIEQALKKELDKATKVPHQPEAPSELQKAIGYYFGGKNADASGLDE